MSFVSILSQYGVTASTTRKTSSTVDAFGGAIISYATNIASLVVLHQSAGGNEGVRYARENTRYAGVAYCVQGLDIAETDRLVIGSETWEIASIRNPDRRTALSVTGYVILLLERTLP